MTYQELANQIRSIAKPYLPAGKFNSLCNKLSKITLGIHRGQERRHAPAAVQAYSEAPDYAETQEQAVLRRLLAGETLDAWDALMNCTDIRSMQLRTLVCKLGKKGYNIARERITLPSGKWTMRYWMNEDERAKYITPDEELPSETDALRN